MQDITKIIAKIQELDSQNKIQFIVLFGSKATGNHNKLSDTDIAIYYEGNSKERFEFRIKALGQFSDKVDILIFQDCSLILQNEIIQGKVLYSREYDFTFTIFKEVIDKYKLFRPHLETYLQAARGGLHET